MNESYEGRQVIGMDLHRRRSVLVRMTESGEHLETVRIVNDPDRLAEVLCRAGEHPDVVLEAMSRGVPVACSNRAAHPEVVGPGHEPLEAGDGLDDLAQLDLELASLHHRVGREERSHLGIGPEQPLVEMLDDLVDSLEETTGRPRQECIALASSLIEERHKEISALMPAELHDNLQARLNRMQ